MAKIGEGGPSSIDDSGRSGNPGEVPDTDTLNPIPGPTKISDKNRPHENRIICDSVRMQIVGEREDLEEKAKRRCQLTANVEKIESKHSEPNPLSHQFFKS